MNERNKMKGGKEMREREKNLTEKFVLLLLLHTYNRERENIYKQEPSSSS